ncbi:hypothetical protein HK098_001906 [Nowakowskiella sp. JEL0407]|nr:hypothetical protein HK098_001906 [Nowakowskiella sp. JEL0407]
MVSLSSEASTPVLSNALNVTHSELIVIRHVQIINRVERSVVQRSSGGGTAHYTPPALASRHGEEALRKLFERHGPVVQVDYVLKGLPPFAFVHFTTLQNAKSAIDNLHGVKVNGRSLVVRFATEKKAASTEPINHKLQARPASTDIRSRIEELEKKLASLENPENSTEKSMESKQLTDRDSSIPKSRGRLKVVGSNDSRNGEEKKKRMFRPTALAPEILQSIADMRQGSSEIQICSSIGLKLTPDEIAHYRCKSDTLLLDLLWDVEVELVEFVGQYVNYKSHGTVVIDGVVDVSSSSKRVGEFGSVKRKEDADEDAGSSGVGSGSGKGEVGKSDPPMVPKRLVALLLPKKYTSEFDYVEGRMTFGYSRHTTNDRENGIFFNHATKANRK